MNAGNEPKKPSILIVDDETSNIDVLKFILEDKYKLFIAKSGEQAIRIARERLPDLILLDVIMPGISGFETLAEIEKSELTKHIPVIFITGQDNTENEVKGLNMGAVDYIKKPFHNVIVESRVGIHMKILEQMRTIERMSVTDELTDLPNRRYFNELLAREWGRAIRETTSISLLFIDVDRFKAYNDTYGHQHGDLLLRSLGMVFKHSLMRPTDLVARWGGEEFVMIMPQTNLEGALVIAERIRTSVEKMVLPYADGKETRVTVSIGVNSEQPTEDMSSAVFVSRADNALYMAKNTGRNRVCVYSTSSEAPGNL